MTPKFRIYDKQEKEYIQDSYYRWMVSRKGRLYNSENDEWHETGARYLVEMELDWTSEDGVCIYQGDILSCTNPNDGDVYITSFGLLPIDGVCFNNHALSFELSLYGYSLPNNIKIIGTIHDEKYKNL